MMRKTAVVNSMTRRMQWVINRVTARHRAQTPRSPFSVYPALAPFGSNADQGLYTLRDLMNGWEVVKGKTQNCFQIVREDFNKEERIQKKPDPKTQSLRNSKGSDRPRWEYIP